MTGAETYGRAPHLPALRGVVERLWYVADPAMGGEEIKLPTTTTQIIVNLDSERLTTRMPVAHGSELACGPVGLAPIASSAVVLDRREQRRSAGVVLRPEAFAAITGDSAEGLDPLVDLDHLHGRAAARLAEVAREGRSGPDVLDRLEGALATLLGDHTGGDPVCRMAIGLLREGRRVAEVSAYLAIGQSTLARRFRRATGMSPKRYQRLLRLERTVELAAGHSLPDWADLAVDAGYYDQAHLAREFSDLTGLTPTQWRRAIWDNPFHVMVPSRPR